MVVCIICLMTNMQYANSCSSNKFDSSFETWTGLWRDRFSQEASWWARPLWQPGVDHFFIDRLVSVYPSGKIGIVEIASFFQAFSCRWAARTATVTCNGTESTAGVVEWNPKHPASPGCHRGSSSGTQKHSACQFDVGVLYRLHRKVGNRETSRSVNSGDLVIMPCFWKVDTWMNILHHLAI